MIKNVRRGERGAGDLQQRVLEHDPQREDEEEPHRRVDERDVEWSRACGGVVDEEAEVGVEEEEGDEREEDGGGEEELEDPGDCPDGHEDVGEDEGEADAFDHCLLFRYSVFDIRYSEMR